MTMTAVVTEKQILVVPSPDEVYRSPKVRTIVEPESWERYAAEFAIDLSGRELSHSLLSHEQQVRHGVYHQTIANAIVFGAHHFHAAVSAGNRFDCPDINGYRFRLEVHTSDAFHPGRHLPIPQITGSDEGYCIDYGNCDDEKTTNIQESVYFATPIEPGNWGSWLLNAVPSALDFLNERPAEKLMICVAHRWQRALLNDLGVTDELIVHQELAATYRCRDVVLRQYSTTDLAPPARDIDIFERVRSQFARTRTGRRRRLFVSRLSVSQGGGRVLLNENELVAAVAAEGFEVVEPEQLTFVEQVRVFADAELVVGLGGAGLFNVVFCRSDTQVVTIESTNAFLYHHSSLFAGLGLRYGVILGRQDESDSTPVHKRWWIDVPEVVRILRTL
jgi:hypothetical protein